MLDELVRKGKEKVGKATREKNLAIDEIGPEDRGKWGLIELNESGAMTGGVGVACSSGQRMRGWSLGLIWEQSRKGARYMLLTSEPEYAL